MPGQNWEEEKPKVEIPYEKHKMPRALLWIWAAFFVWAAVYLGRYLIPDLRQWLSR